MRKHYDYLVVGAGLFGAVFAHEAVKAGFTVLVLEKRDHIAGNIYTEEVEGIDVHKYGAHIFHTSDKNIWSYVDKFAEFNNFVNSPVANYKGEMYNMPFNMNTFSKMFNISTPAEAMEVLDKERAEITGEPQNLEEQAISLVGRTVYTKLVKGYTEKQWGRDCTELPAFIIKRLPVRFTYDNNYFNDRYQGIPCEGYTTMVERMLDGADVVLNTNFLDDREKWLGMADNCVYTGPIDEYFGYKLGKLESPSSTTPTARPHTPGSSNTSTSTSAPSRRRSSPASTRRPGKRAWSPITPSMTSATRTCTTSTRNWPPAKASCSADVWPSTGITIWTIPLPQP